MSNYLDGKYKTFQELMTGMPEEKYNAPMTPPYLNTPSLISKVYNAQGKFIEKTSISPNVVFLGKQEKQQLKEFAGNVNLSTDKKIKRFNAICGLKVRFSRKNSEISPAFILGAL